MPVSRYGSSGVGFPGFFLFAFAIIMFVPSSQLFATHIVGGEMGYTCLGNNQYEIRLTIYRDCFFGNPDAYFDDPASIGVFDSNNFLLQDIRINLMGDDTLSPVLTNECLVIPPSVCVHTTTYRTIVELAPRPGGYQLAYQRCCRNQTIANIIDPLGTGATYGVTISERALNECNSSAEFLQWPPLYICADEPIIFDQSAVDADGDSIVYRLCTPLLGANPDVPRPQPPNNPPYSEVVWNDPPYNVDNMLNGVPGGAPLAIDPQTGLLTGTPNTVGQFVVGICAEEYRNGELISTSRRDFQYNVGICGQTTSAFFAPEIQCDGLEVFATNQSVGTTNFLWIFGDPTDPLGTSEEENPSFEFPDYGTYPITLIAAAGEPCADTFVQDIQLLPLSLQPAFRLDTLSCGDSLVLQVVDLSEDSLSVITTWEWTLNGDIVSTDQAPVITITETGNYVIGLSLSAENGCENSTASGLQGVSFIQETLPGDSLFICPGDSVYLNPAFLSVYTYQWTPIESLDDASSPNPQAFPAETTDYQLLLTDSSGICSSERNITVVVNPPLSVVVSPDTVSCATSIALFASSPTAIRYFWSPIEDFSSQVTEGMNFVASPIGDQTYYIQVVDSAGCSLTDSVNVNSLAVNIALVSADTSLCLGDQIQLAVNNTDPADELSYQWMPDELIIAGAQSATPTVEPTEAGTVAFSFIATNQHDCLTNDSILVTTIDPLTFGVGLEYQQCSGRRVDFTSDDPAAAVYQWHFGDPLQPNANAVGASVSHTYSAAGTFQLMITLPAYLACQDTAFLEVTVAEEGLIFPDFTWSYLNCEETATITIADASTANGTTIEAWSWYENDLLVSEESMFNLMIDSSAILNISLVTTAANGCVDTVSQQLEVPVISLNLMEQLLLCPGESVFLNPSADLAYIYQWTPGVGLNDSTAANPLAMPLVSTTYNLTVSDPNSICMRTDSILVELSPMPNYFLSPDTATCEPIAQIFAESADPLSYLWADDLSFTTVLGTNPFLEVSARPETYYYLQLTDSLGCQFTDSVLVDGRGVDIIVPPEQIVCQQDTITLTASSANIYPIINFQWSPASIIIGPDDQAEVTIAPLDNTIMQLSVSNAFGCEADTFVRVNLQQMLPILQVVPLRDTILPGESVQLGATEEEGYSYQWSPAAGLSNTTIPDPLATPEETTVYELVIRDSHGCENSAQLELVVLNTACRAPFIFVPNAFTPNDDSLNDLLLVEGNVIDVFYLAIYDRWGEQVFESRQQAQGWDGTYQGSDLAPDVYGYYLEVSCLDGSVYTDKGNITLIR